MKEELKKWIFADLKAASDFIVQCMGMSIDWPEHEKERKIKSALELEMMYRLAALKELPD